VARVARCAPVVVDPSLAEEARLARNARPFHEAHRRTINTLHTCGASFANPTDCVGDAAQVRVTSRAFAQAELTVHAALAQQTLSRVGSRGARRAGVQINAAVEARRARLRCGADLAFERNAILALHTRACRCVAALRTERADLARRAWGRHSICHRRALARKIAPRRRSGRAHYSSSNYM
jgi:hypothetical protein